MAAIVCPTCGAVDVDNSEGWRKVRVCAACQREAAQCEPTRRACPSCPDGYVWTREGPTGAACKTCGGKAYLDGDD
jgi:hypothetical protein